MKLTDLKVGEVYVSLYSGYKWYIRIQGISSSGTIRYLSYSCQEFFYEGPGEWGNFDCFSVGLRETTNIEKEWFKSMEESKKYTPLENFKGSEELYSIY